MNNLLLVEGHTIVRKSLRAMIEKMGEFRVVGEVENGAEAVEFCRNHRPDLILMDLSMPVLNGIEATAEIARHWPETRVVVLSASDGEHHVVEAIRAGARGYLLKRAGASDLREALRTVISGGSYLSPDISTALMARLQTGGGAPARKSGREGLSPRETQVMRLIAEGLTSKEIAVSLNLGVETIRSYRKTLMKKLGVSNAAGITRVAVEANGGPVPVQ